MGYEIGNNINCRKNGKIHIECSNGLVQFWTTPEMTPVLSLEKEDARKVQEALNWGLDWYYNE
jgi:hypothetical protein